MEVLTVKRIPVTLPNSEQTADMTVITALSSPYGIIQDYISDDILEKGRFFEEDEVARVIADLSPGDLFVDIGANIGTFSVAAEAVGATAVAIEPQPILQKTLKKNVKGEVHGVACGTAPEPCPMFNNYMRHPRRAGIMANLGAASLGETHGRKPTGITVPVKTLDSIIGKRNPKVIKIDVEGLEADVLASGIKMLTRCKPIIYAENNHGDELAACYKLLKPLGYRIDDVIGGLYSSTVVRYAV